MDAVGVSRNTMTTATTTTITNNNDNNKKYCNKKKTLIKNFNLQNLKTEYSK